MDVLRFLIALKIFILCAVKLGESMKCYRCTHRAGPDQFPPGVLPATMADNKQCVDPFNSTHNKVSLTNCERGHCVKRIYKFEDTRFYERDCMSSCDNFSGKKVQGFDNVRLSQACCDADKCNAAPAAFYLSATWWWCLVLMSGVTVWLSNTEGTV